MSKILLLDFDEKARDFLASEKYDVELRSTAPLPESEEPLEIPGDAEVVLVDLEAAGPGRSDVKPGFRDALARRVEDGVKVVCFVGDGDPGRLSGILGEFEGLGFQDSVRAESIVFSPRALFHVPFERFRPYLNRAFKLTAEPAGEGVWEKDSPASGKMEFLAKTNDGYPVALLSRRGRGYYLLLPSFGAKNGEVADYILKDKTPFTADTAPEAVGDWLDQEDYIFPDLRELVIRKDEERRRHETTMAEIDARIKEIKAGGEAALHGLLAGEGPELKRAVVHALGYLGWGRVVDVDAYWKNVIRNKEEDVWLIDPEDQNIEVSMRKESLILVIVRGGRNWATDDECALLQKFKGRRMQEFDNTKMKAILVGNYFSATDPKTRGNPFSAVQIEEATKDGNGLLTTYELFKAVKAEKEKLISKEAVRAQIKEKTGFITLDV